MQTSVENGEDDEDKEYMPAELQKLVNDAMEALDRQAKMS